MPTETQHLEQRVAALQSDLNARDQALDDTATENNERELSRRDWFEEAQRLEKEVEELRALLDQPAEQHQGEPVAWVLVRDGEVCYEADDGIVISNVRGDETDLYIWEPVWFGKPAPAAVVLPGRKIINVLNYQASIGAEGWNACLDEVARLNPPLQ